MKSEELWATAMPRLTERKGTRVKDGGWRVKDEGWRVKDCDWLGKNGGGAHFFEDKFGILIVNE